MGNAVYLVVAFLIVAIVAAIIILVGRADWTKPIQGAQSDRFHLPPSPLTLIEMMIRFFSKTLLPALQRLRDATSPLMGAGASSPPQPILPQYAETGFQQPAVTPPCPVVPRDNSFRVPSNPYTGSSYSEYAFPGPIAY
ncbi:hypothetical protein EI94DRAFT_1815480 [Lactarius quietus]|nr:hypothetical protein EI94DRAFT_1815480 [Lactarius quietus]